MPRRTGPEWSPAPVVRIGYYVVTSRRTRSAQTFVQAPLHLRQGRVELLVVGRNEVLGVAVLEAHGLGRLCRVGEVLVFPDLAAHLVDHLDAYDRPSDLVDAQPCALG